MALCSEFSEKYEKGAQHAVPLGIWTLSPQTQGTSDSIPVPAFRQKRIVHHVFRSTVRVPWFGHRCQVGYG